MTNSDLVGSLRKCLAEERKAESDEAHALAADVPIRSLELAGLAIRRLQIVEQKTALGGRFYLEMGLANNDDLPPTRLSSGSIVQIKSGNTILTEFGTVVRVMKKVMVVSVDEWEADGFSFFTIILTYNDVAYRRCGRGLDQISQISPSSISYNLSTLLLGSIPPFHPSSIISPVSRTSLNDGQYAAVSGALSSQDVFIIHGPPGCGKTTTLCHFIKEAVRSGQKVLACAPSNIAVDGMVEQLASQGLRLVRLGHPARILPHIIKYALDEIISRSDTFQLTKDVKSELKALNKRPSSKPTAEDRKNTRNERKLLRADLKKLENRVIDEIIGRAQVVLSTCVGADVHPLRGKSFDIAVIDEAAQGMEAICWLPVLKCKKLVLAGDHKQLAPTVKSDLGEKTPTMFERVHSMLQATRPESISMLTRQYRMHEDIQKWSSDEFYNGKLVADESVAGHLLRDLPNVRKTSDTSSALLFIDTAECDLDEEVTDSGDPLNQMSKGNSSEARIVAIHTLRLLSAGLKPDQIGILTPYNRQIGLCRRALSDLAEGAILEQVELIEIGTVDGFQGREKEAIIMSMVRSNADHEVGFLSDQRRMNVACTRARRHLAVVGDSNTLSVLPFIKRLIQHMEDYGEYRPATLYEYQDSIDEIDFEFDSE